MRFLSKILFILIITFPWSVVNAQNMLVNIEHFSINDGLSQNAINCLFQDSRGYIWIGTQDGLNKYDGYTFKTYRHAPDDEYSLSSNYVRYIVEDEDSCLWIATQDGLNKFDYRTGLFESFFHEESNSSSLYENDIKTMYLDKLGFIWLKTDKGVDQFNIKTKKFSYNKHEYDEFSFATEYNYYSITDDNEGVLWMGSKDGLLSYDRVNQQFCTYKIDSKKQGGFNEIFCTYINTKNEFLVGTKSGLYSFDKKTKFFEKLYPDVEMDIVRVIYEDNKGTTWIGTEEGVVYIDSKTKKICNLSFRKTYVKEVFFGRVTSIFQDNSDILWISSDNGLFKIDRKDEKFKLINQNVFEGLKLSTDRTYSIYKYKNDDILIGTRKYGFNLLNIKNNTIKQFTSEKYPLLKDDNIHCIYEDTDKNIWVGTSNGAFIFDKAKSTFTSFSDYTGKNVDHYLKNNRITAILQDTNGNYWISTFNGLLFVSEDRIEIFKNKRNAPKEIASSEVLNIIERKDKSIWVATVKGVSKFNPTGRDFINFNRDNSNLSNNSCLTIFESIDGTLWVGTETGLNKFIEETGRFEFYTSKSHGFSNDYIYAIVEDNNRYLWMSTNKGIVKFNPFTSEVTNFNLEDGLQSYEFNIGASYRHYDGEIYFGGVNGFNYFYPDSLSKNPYVPMPIITRFVKKSSFGEKNIILGNSNVINLSYNERSFDIYFALLEYSHPQKNKFKYRIKEIDAKWTNNGTKNYAGFIRLSPGEYTFELEAANSDNQWNYSPLVLKIIIASPWWRTNFAILSYLVLIISVLVWGISSYNKNIRSENRVLQEKDKASKEVALQKEELAIKNKNISDSIRYAKRIIEAMIPSERYFRRLLPESFILFKPKDIVSGDFYWIDKEDDKVFVAAVDCTGHGVPGSFMSIIGIDLLRNILSLGIESPSEILLKLNSEVASIFKKEDDQEDYVRDGMDLAICSIDKKNKKLEFSGAINRIYIVRKDNIIELKGDRMSIGPSDVQQQVKFKNHTFDLEKDDVIYMFTDGFADQFGGSAGKKYKYRRFRHLLLNIYKYDLAKQKTVMNDVIELWKGSNEQVDDILVIGIKPF